MTFYGQWDPQVDEVLLRNYFEDKKEGLCAEAGAADGLSYTCCKYFEDMGWQCLNIEANKQNFSKLVINRTRSINVNAAISEKDGKAIFRNDSIVRLASNEESGEETIQTISYETLLLKVHFRQIDLFCLDVEGHEPEVLRGIMASNLRLPKVFCIEYPYCTIETITSIIGSKYRLDGVSFNNIYFSLPEEKVRTPFWGRTEIVKQEKGQWVFPEKAEY